MTDVDDAKILVVDDDEIDRETLRRAVRRAGSDMEIVEAEDGVEALALLRGEGPEALTAPLIVVLDLSMPRLDGYEVLAALRADPALKHTPVFVMSTSDADAHRDRAHDYGVAGYIVKSSAREALASVVAMLDHYRRVVSLPI